MGVFQIRAERIQAPGSGEVVTTPRTNLAPVPGAFGSHLTPMASVADHEKCRNKGVVALCCKARTTALGSQIGQGLSVPRTLCLTRTRSACEAPGRCGHRSV